MPYFSFSLNNNFNINYTNKSEFKLNKVESNKKYFSKNTYLWKKLNDTQFETEFGYVPTTPRPSERLFGGRYEHNTFNAGNVTGVEAENRANDKNTGNWTDDSDS